MRAVAATDLCLTRVKETAEDPMKEQEGCCGAEIGPRDLESQATGVTGCN